MIRHMTSTLLKTRDDGLELSIGKYWVKKFMKRHSKLGLTWSIVVESRRVAAVENHTILSFLKRFKACHHKYDKDITDCWNMDEKGFVLGYGVRTRVVVRILRRQYQKSMGEGWVSTLQPNPRATDDRYSSHSVAASYSHSSHPLDSGRGKWVYHHRIR